MLRSLAITLLLALIPLTTLGQTTELQYTNPPGQDGINTFEPPTEPGVEYDGFALDWGASFTQQFQNLTHSTDAILDPDNDGTPENALPELDGGFNLATANLDLAAQLERGIKVNVTTYLSSRHHPEAWVKGGYLQVDQLPMFHSAALDRVMEYVTIRAGHFEINYGDAHFRRTDNANAIHNPFVGNYLLDSFNTEIGGEIYVRSNGLLAMGAITGGEINGGVVDPPNANRGPSFYGKMGFDRQINPSLRLRLTGSGYYTKTSIANHLHSGDRAGSRYYSVLGGGDWSGRIRSSFGDQVTAFMLNPFVKVGGLEVFGVIESVSGSRAGLDDGSLTQYSAEAIYRFASEDLYVGARYNTVNGDLNVAGGWASDLTIDRVQVGAGWFVTSNILMKAEYVTQSYDGYPEIDVHHGGEFSGVMIEGVIAF